MIDSFRGEFAFLSNFYDDANSVEIKYQATKTRNRDNIVSIYKSGTASNAKRIGTQVIGLRDNWEAIKVETMWRLVWEKFFFDATLQRWLLATEDEELIEGNYWHDNFWGDCRCEKCRSTPGNNMLGRILMDVRQRLQDEDQLSEQ